MRLMHAFFAPHARCGTHVKKPTADKRKQFLKDTAMKCKMLYNKILSKTNRLSSEGRTIAKLKPLFKKLHRVRIEIEILF